MINCREDKIFIGGNVPSSKNGKQWTGKILINSKSTQKYIVRTKLEWIVYRNKFISLLQGERKPYKISFKFIRGTRHKFDYVNPLQTVQDLMVKNGWIDDDNADELIPILEPYEYDKNQPGVVISVIQRNGEQSKQVLDKDRCRSGTQGSAFQENDSREDRKEEGRPQGLERQCDSEDIHSRC